MRRLWFVLALALLLGQVPAVALAAEPQISDVPPGHWAYQAVKKLVASGYLGLYPDNTFRGDQPVDRYTLAVVVSRLLGDAVSGKTAMTKEDSDLLRKLTGEFRQELVAISMRTKSLEDALAQYERERAALGADVAALRTESQQIKDELAAVAREILQLKERVASLEKRVDQQSQSISDLQQGQSTTDGRTEELEKQVTVLRWMTIILAVLAGVLGVAF